MGGVIALTLTACGTDSVYDEMDQQNNEMNAPPSFNDSDSGIYTGPGYNHPGINYLSPWDLGLRNQPYPGFGILQPWYFFTNGNVDDPTPYHLEAIPYVGLAYFDGDDDGVFNDVNKNISIPLAANLGGNYPNLYGGSSLIPGQGQEVGKLVRAANTFYAPSYPHPESSLRVESKDFHMHKNSATARYPNLPGYDKFFTFGNLTGPERDLLYEYGKVFFYEVNVYDKYTGALVLSTLMHPAINTLPGRDPQDLDPNWKQVNGGLSGVQLTGNVPTQGYSANLYYIDNNNSSASNTQWLITNPNNYGNSCDSHEVVFDVPLVPHEVDIDGTYKLRLSFFGSGQTGWINTALHLNLTSH